MNPCGDNPEREPAVEACGLVHHYGVRVVLRDLDLRVAVGQRVALRGANGSGKTTLLRCLAGTLRPTDGRLLWFGQPAAATLAARRRVGWVAHDSFLYPDLTLRENLLFAARMTDVAAPADCAARWIDAAGLGRWAHQPAGRVSRGTRQRAALARALIHDPELVILDEPFSGLDPDGLRWCLDVLETLHQRRRTVILSTHDAALARRLADRIVRLHAGRLTPDETCAEAAA